MSSIPSPLLKVTDDPITGNNLSEHLEFPSRNDSLRDGCIRVAVSEMEYIPWDNPDNIVSAEVESVVRRIQYNILGLMFVVGTPANIINMAVFYKQGLKDRVNLCLFALSLSDGLFLLTFMFLYGEQLHIQFTTKENYGPMTTFLFNHNFGGFVGFGYVSIILSAIIATERCLCVFNPLKFQRLIRTRTMTSTIIVIYIVMLGLFFIVVFRYRIKCIYDPTIGVVSKAFVKGAFYEAHKKEIDLLDSVVFGAGLPGIVMIVVITATILTIVKLRQIVTWRSDASSQISPREVALTKMLVGNSILFIICFSPDAINHFSRMFVPELNSGGRYHNIYLTIVWLGDIFSFFNATLNFFVYYTMGSRYRETFWALCGRKPNRERVQDTVSYTGKSHNAPENRTT